jgi:flagellin
MSFSIQTNVNSLIAQENLRVNTNFQGQTIQRLTSGYRINSSGDDAAGLAVANKYRSDTSELSQGVRNANDGISTLQIIDGGMNNISKMLDRLRTLATQSASQTFTGDRSVLNSEFQSLVTEIDRQSQSIGLSQGGQFAKSLSVFIGGGKSSDGTGALSTANGSVTVNLTSSTVDSKSLGLTGFQVVAGSVDIGNGSSTTKVSQIVGNASNGTSGTTSLYFAGAGFSDADKVNVSVNLQGVTDLNTLVTSINAAIQSAGNGSSPSQTAFKDAGIVASVHTSDNGTQQLAFTSGSTAFQVAAGDQMANALMGNFANASTALGNSISTTLTGGAIATSSAPNSFSPSGVTVRISGAGMAAPVDITGLTSTTVDTATTELVNAINTNSDLQAAGISVENNGNHLVFTSARGESIGVEATGDTNGSLGLGSFLHGNTGNAVDYSAYTTSVAYDNTSTAVHGDSKLAISLNGGATVAPIDLDLSAGNATAATVQSTGAVNGNFQITAANDTVTVSLNSAASPTTYTLAHTTQAAVVGTLTSASAGPFVIAGATGAVSGNTAVDYSVGANCNFSSAVTAASVTGATDFRTAAACDFAAGNAASFKISVDGGGAQTVTLNAAYADISALETAIQGQLTGATVSNDASGHLSITNSTTGASHSVQITQAGAGFTDVALKHGTDNKSTSFAVNIDGAGSHTVTLDQDYGNITNLQNAIRGQLVTAATVANDGSGHISIASSKTGAGASVAVTSGTFLANATATGADGNNKLSISVDGAAATTLTLASGSYADAGALLTQLTTQLTGTGVTAAFDAANGNKLTLTDANTGSVNSISLNNTANGAAGILGLTANGSVHSGVLTDISAVAADLQTKIGAGSATVTVVGGKLNIDTVAKGSSANIQVTGGTAAATLNLSTVAAASTGTNRTADDIVKTLNQAFTDSSSYPTLAPAHLQASNNAGILTITSNNGTNFRLDAGGSAATADIGFGTSGQAFAGMSGTTVTSHATVLDAGGASYVQANGLNFASMTFGNDDQSITVTANDPSGSAQSKTITLQNDGTARTGRSIDESVAYINKQLQESNIATLQKIVAVKDNSTGVEKINFLSSLDSFTVSTGNSVNGDGVASGAASTYKSVTNGAGGTVSVNTQAGALQAVAAVAAAVTKLGSAQAAVGKGQNQLNYAVGLAQSQISNFSAAESRIRDADVASEAANLTKAQVLQQASIAAMAQANSAPQAVLSLLRG